jgi:predicted house-cleaning noncanonical NTP pyrophosphatase (MazG superfamily)
MTKYNKLVRDKIPEYLDSIGVSYERRTADSKEYKKELIKKLNEEVEEFFENNNVGELADIVEVINALKKIKEFSNVEKMRLKKLKEKGGFKKRIILKGEK